MGRAVSLMLKLLDCESKAFFNARGAAQLLLAGTSPDLMILDINMPEVSGLDLLEFLRRRKEWKNLPVVMLSSEATDVMVDRALEMGADSYVMKPVTIEELEKAMATAFYRHSVV
jgi:DNA-binding response OmpR family regulator